MPFTPQTLPSEAQSGPVLLPATSNPLEKHTASLQQPVGPGSLTWWPGPLWLHAQPAPGLEDVLTSSCENPTLAAVYGRSVCTSGISQEDCVLRAGLNVKISSHWLGEGVKQMCQERLKSQTICGLEEPDDSVVITCQGDLSKQDELLGR